MPGTIDSRSTLSTPHKRRWLRWLLGLILLVLVVGSIAVGVLTYRFGAMDMQERTLYVQGFVTSGVSDFLDLRPEQKKKLDVLGSVIAKKRQQLPLRKWHEQSLVLISGPEFKREQAQVLVNTMIQTGQEASPQVLAAMADFYDSLTENQQEKIRVRWMELGERGFEDEDENK